MSSPTPTPDAMWAGVTRLILGSKSWSRKTLLKQLNPPPFEIISPSIDEDAIKAPTPSDLVLAIAHAKADALLARDEVIAPAARDPSSPSGRTLLLCGDAVVAHKGIVLSKPETPAQAREFLHSYADAPATTVSSVVLVDVASRQRFVGVDEAEVYFRPLPDQIIEHLISDGGAMESAGGLRIENELVQPFIDCIIGDRSAVMGFSQPLVKRLLMEAVAAAGNYRFMQ